MNIGSYQSNYQKQNNVFLKKKTRKNSEQIPDRLQEWNRQETSTLTT